MPTFFSDRPPGGIGLAIFLNAGDPSFDHLAEMVPMLDRGGVDCLELAVPFPDSVSDGPVIRRSAERGLAGGADLASVLTFLDRIRPGLSHLRIALLVDWSHSVRAAGLDEVFRRAQGAGADAILVHGLPPRLRAAHDDAAGRTGLPVVTTGYATSQPGILDDMARRASAYFYLVAQYGRTGTAPARGYDALAPVIGALRRVTTVPVAVGFGVTRADQVEALRRAGADAAIVGSACAAAIEAALRLGRDPVEDLAAFVQGLRPSPVRSAEGAVRFAEERPA
ncbi:tryptophan synthase subunit alpha [Inquilinus sp. OTU3971]|uniref:tryptophan synthase subunit alpha n=1 Tax=Inquilinus sp. OTU3971 TaxID=3043855 RepID=UPI00313C8F75